MTVTPALLQALVEIERGRQVAPEALVALQNMELTNFTMGLTDKGKTALLAHLRMELANLNACLTRERNGNWYVFQGRNDDYNRALEGLLGKPDPRAVRRGVKRSHT